jgi:hypothetical protein
MYCVVPSLSPSEASQADIFLVLIELHKQFIHPSPLQKSKISSANTIVYLSNSDRNWPLVLIRARSDLLIAVPLRGNFGNWDILTTFG